MNAEIEYDCRWSNAVDDKFIDDYCYLQGAVFGNNYSRELFNKKFLKNIYGASILVVVYIGGERAAARAFWRNDVDEKEAYQPGDVCVIEKYRGQGIFTEMTNKAIGMLPKDAVIYTFPNSNSFPGHIKMGNKLLASYYPRLFSYTKYEKEHTLLLDEKYIDWWLDERNDIKFIRRTGKYYLVLPYVLPMMYMVLSEVKREVALRYKKCSFGIFFYRSTKRTFYNYKKRPVHIVCKYDNIEYIPTWKVDSLGY